MSCQFIHKDHVIDFNMMIEYIDSRNSELLKDWEKETFAFIKSWFEGVLEYEIQTSGSTGKPKMIKVHRSDMELSAGMTLDFLHIKGNETALLCLPVKYIAGKMMIMRALVGNLTLILEEPNKDPLSSLNKAIDFMAITPHQLNHILENAESKQKLKNVRNVIVGGGAVNQSSKSIIENWNNNIFSTYGMTETLSHIAMAKLTGSQKGVFQIINDQFKISVDDKSCLRIKTPFAHLPELKTNDIVELIDEKTFVWLGRVDNFINSGGIKFMPEELEKRIQHLIPDPFIVSSQEDKELGEKLVLIIESGNKELYNGQDFLDKLENSFDNKYEVPKEVLLTLQLSYTENGKIDRIGNREMINT